jgi:hypothetical protein
MTIDTTVQLSTTSLNFGNQLKGATSAPQTVTLMNTSDQPLSGVSVSVKGANAQDFTETNSCPSTLAATSNCTITVTFTPSYSGSRTATLYINDSDATSPQQVGLSGTGTLPAASLSPPSLNFGNGVVGTTGPAQDLTLTNNGTASLTITSITVSGSTNFNQTNNCGSSLAVGVSCTISVTFTPNGTWTNTASLKVSDNSSPPTQQASLSGTGIQSKVKLSNYSLNFGNQVWESASTAKTVTLTNSGTATLNITSIGVTGSNAVDFAETNNCGNSVAPNATCSINVTFTPSALGSRSASVTSTDDAPNSPQTVSLTGTGTTSVSFTPKNLNFGSHKVGHTSSPINITVTNLGTSQGLSIQGITITGSNAGDFAETNTCGSSLSAGANCTISVIFTPSETGTRAATLQISDDDPASPQDVSLAGTGS